MTDQAESLRKLIQRQQAGERTRVLAFSAMSPDSGKSSFTWETAALLARNGRRILFVDTDPFSGLEVGAETPLFEAYESRTDLLECIREVEPGLWRIVTRDPTEEVRQRLVDWVFHCPWEFDFIIWDGESSSYSETSTLCHQVEWVNILILSQEDEVSQAYEFIKRIETLKKINRWGLISVTRKAENARRIFKETQKLSSVYLQVSIDYLGHFSQEEKLNRAMLNQKFLIDLYPRAQILRHFELLLKRMSFFSSWSDLYVDQLVKKARARRFQDEPVPWVPWKLAKRIQALFREVKA